MRFILVLSLLSSLSAATINVTPASSFNTIEAAVAGDTVVFAPGTYAYRLWLRQTGTTANPITLIAQDPNNRPVFDYSTQVTENWPGSFQNSDKNRGCWQLGGPTGGGHHYIIDGFIIKGCHSTTTDDSAGIRFLAVDTLLVRNSLFQTNHNGVQGGGSNITFEFDEFDHCGNSVSDQDHSIYILGGINFTLRYSYVHDSQGGQNFHIRSRASVLAYNWFQHANAYEGDTMTPGTSQDLTPPVNQDITMLFIGNIVVSNPTPFNDTKLFTMWCDPACTVTPQNHKWTMIWNTFYVTATGTTPAIVQQNNTQGGTRSLVFQNNIVLWKNTTAGHQVLTVSDRSLTNWSRSGDTNLFQPGMNVENFTNTIFNANFGMTNPTTFDFTLQPGSPAIAAANTGVTPVPISQGNLTAGIFSTFPRATFNDLGALSSGAPPPMTITTASPLIGGNTGAAYLVTLTESGGTSPFTWTLLSGTLPAGLTVSSVGVISGTPTTAGTSTFTIRLTDTNSSTTQKTFSLTITAPVVPVGNPGAVTGIVGNAVIR